MSDHATSTIAQLLFVKRPDLNFAHVVGELDSALARIPADRRTLTWDCDDVAVFDLDGSRIVLGFAEDLRGDYAACLTVSVGHGPSGSLSQLLAKRRDGLCRMITDRLTGRYGIDETIWHEAREPVTSDLIDALIDQLPRRPMPAPPPAPTPILIAAPIAPAPKPAPAMNRPIEVDRLMSRMGAELAARVDNQRHSDRRVVRKVPVSADPAPAALLARVGKTPCDLARVREALYPVVAKVVREDVEEPALPVRMACHVLNATLVLAAPPIGAVLIAASVLRGEDMQLTARVMALTGTVLGLGNTPMGQQVMALI